VTKRNYDYLVEFDIAPEVLHQGGWFGAEKKRIESGLTALFNAQAKTIDFSFVAEKENYPGTVGVEIFGIDESLLGEIKKIPGAGYIEPLMRYS
jgi:hypothetical protein